MTVEEGIKKLGGMFREMKIDTQEQPTVIYVVVQFPERWVVDEATSEKFKVNYAPNNGLLYFYADMEVGTVAIFDAILYNVDRNKEAQERGDLFNAKVQELRELFMQQEVTLDELKRLTFVLGKSQAPTMVSNNVSKKK